MDFDVDYQFECVGDDMVFVFCDFFVGVIVMWVVVFGGFYVLVVDDIGGGCGFVFFQFVCGYDECVVDCL